MGDRTHRHERGFTLVEMMVAIGILLFGVTTLVGVLGVGVATRRSAEQQLRAARLVDQVLYRLETQYLPSIPPESEEIPPLEVDAPEGFPEMKYRVDFAFDPKQPLVVLATISMRWREQGEAIGVEYRRVMFRETPFPQRVQRLRSKQ